MFGITKTLGRWSSCVTVLLLTFIASVGGLVRIPAAFAAPGDIYNLGTLGGRSSSGASINDDGQVAGEAQAGNLALHAFRYSGTPGAGGSMADLGTLGGGTVSRGAAINRTGQVAGWSNRTGGVQHAFRYTGTPGAGGTMVDLGTLGGTMSEARAINNSSQITGYSRTSAGSRHAFLYTGTPGAGGAMMDLGTLGGTDSYALAINDTGQIAGWSYSVAGALSQHAFRYTGTPGAGGVMVDLGTLGGTTSSGSGINDAGFVVGWADRGSSVYRATLWQTDAGNTAVDLDAWLDTVNPTLGPFWTLSAASDINNQGLITGIGNYYDGPGGLIDGNVAFILDASSLVPEPRSFAVVALATLAPLRSPSRARGP